MGVHEDSEPARNAAMTSAAGLKTCSDFGKDKLSTIGYFSDDAFVVLGITRMPIGMQ
jgi:hypothetical protein